MRNLILISLLVFLFSACHFSVCRSYKRVKSDAINRNIDSYFCNTDSSYLYQSEIRFMKNYYSGMMVIKHQSDSVSRVVFLTEMGIKVFDFEIRNPLKYKDYYKVFYIMEPMSKKIIQKTLANDLGLLLQNAGESDKKYYISKNNQNVVKIKNNCKHFFYLFEKDKGDFKVIDINSLCFKKVEVFFYGKPGLPPDSMNIHHLGMKLDYTFRRIKQ
jgi:hypothetical protein